jgi:hypothetical protein
MKESLCQHGIAWTCSDKNLFHMLWGLLLSFVLLTPTSQAAAQATLSSDLPDYAPGSIVTLTGAGFAPGETVTVQVTHALGDPAGTDPQYHAPWTVTADSAGGFVTTWTVPNDGDAEWASLKATADGTSSGLHAEAFFTDAPLPQCNLSAISGINSRCQGGGQDNYSITFGTVTGFNWTVSGAGNSITFVNGNATVTWGASFSGSATITVSVDGSQCSGQSSKSMSVTVSPLAAVAVATNGSGATATQITANWNAAANANKYLLDVSTDIGFSSFVTANSKVYNGLDVGNVTTATITGLTANTTYYYRVRAANTCATAASSNTITYATLPSAPAAPLAGAGSAAACTQITANWSASAGATAYLLDVATNSNFSTGSIFSTYKDFNVGNVTTLTIPGLTAGTTYFYRLRASNTGGLSAYSDIITYATLPATPATPGTISGLQTVCSGASAVSYSVLPVNGATTYNWTLPAGATIATGSGSNAITVNFGATAGNVSVTAGNSCGTSSPKTLAVAFNTAPAISVQPAVQSLTYGTNAAFTVTAAGTPAPTFQWDEFISSWNGLPNGNGYSGVATATLRVTTPGVAASGRKYRCTISNSCGTATTDGNAVLTVSPRPITITADSLSKTYGDNDPALTAQLTSGSIVGADVATGSLIRVGGENVGSYAINQGVYTYGPNYQETYISRNLTIRPRPVTITADRKTKVYGEGDPALTAQVTGGIIAPDVATGALSRVSGQNVGRYLISKGTYTYGANYLETYVADSLTITPRAITISADILGKIYGNNDPTLTAQVTAGTIVNSDPHTGTLSRASGEDKGVYDISKGTYTYGSNYAEAFVGATFTIGQRPITITADIQTKVYGNSDPTLTAKVTSTIGVVNGDQASGTLLRAAGENVGRYIISKNTYTYGTNYAETYVPDSLAITQRAITVSADALGKTYGNSDPTLTAQVSSGSIVGTDVPSGTLSRISGENVGDYAIQKNTYSYGANYLETYVGANLHIGQRPISITANDTTKVYGGADPVLTARVTAGTIIGTDAPTGSLSRAPGETVGTYLISQNSYTYGANYLETYTGAQLSISRRPVTITADALGKTYGNADPRLTAQVTSGSIVGADTATGALSRAPGEDVGGYAIAQGTYSYGGNYLETYSGASFTIGQRPVSINVTTGQHKTYGDADPAAFAYTVGAGQSLASGDAFSGGLSRQSGDSVGSYNILQTGLTIKNGSTDKWTNYLVTYNGSTFAIGKRPITVTANAQGKTYGDTDPALSYGITSGSLAYSDAFAGALTRDAGENAGAYTIRQGTLAINRNYNISYVGAQLTIGQRPITLTAATKYKTYGNSDPTLTVTVSSGTIVGTDAPAGALSRAPGEAVGSYAIGQNTYTYGSNYLETFVAANLVINPRPLTINVTTGQHKTYGYPDPSSFAYTLGAGQSLASWDAFYGGLSRQSGDSVGSYNILQAGLTIRNGSVDNSSNYNITYNGSTFAIDKRAITISAIAKSKTYGDADPALTYGITSGTLAYSDAFSGSLSRDTGQNVGTYIIRQGSVVLNSNYTVTYVQALLTIRAVVIEIYVGVQAPNHRQYSDTVTIRALIEEGAPRYAGANGAAQTVTFKIGTQVLGTVPFTVSGDDLLATLSAVPLMESTPLGQMAPGKKVITAVLNSPNANYGLTLLNNCARDSSFSIDKEDARIDYSGDQILGTASSTAVTATVKLRANILDITALLSDGAYDPAAGDIRNAKVKFVNRDNNSDISGWIPVSTLVAGDQKIGIVSFDYGVTLGSTETDREITIGIIVDNGYYYRNNTADNTVVTVYKPVGDFITGGGHVVPDRSVGTYKSDANSKTNFGFNVKYNKKGASLQGNMNVIFRRTETDGLLHTYQIKANSMQSLGVNATNPLRQTAQFSSKANLTDVTNPASPIAKGGNKMLYVNMIDNGDPGIKDSISFVLVDGTADPAVLSNIIYSSEWATNKNQQKLLRGGNLVVKSGFSFTSTATATARTVDAAEAERSRTPLVSDEPAVERRFNLRAYPNRTHNYFNMVVESEWDREPITLRIYDMSGRLLQQFSSLLPGQTLQVGSSYARGVYIAEMTQGRRRTQVKLIKE